MRSLSRRIGLILGFTVLSVCLLHAARPAAPPDDPEITPNQNWMRATGDLGNRRYSSLSKINTENVKNLGAAWVSDKFDDAAASGVTPVVKDGVMFVTAGAKVYALDARTGKPIWKYQTTETRIGRVGINLGAGPPNGVGIPNAQGGVALGEGKIFVGLTDAEMMALDEKTGQLVWRLNPGKDFTLVTHPRMSTTPVYSNGVVYICITFGEARYRGAALALDAQDGHVLWRWDAIPGPGEPGHETWTSDPKSEVWRMGGAGLWQPPAVDPDLGLVYYDTGNPSPNKVGAERPGNNLYSSSVVALNMKTGKLRWYFQAIHHDLWEGDLANPVVLYDGPDSSGTMRKGLALMRPDGTLFFLDRATGKPIWPVEERPVRQYAPQKTSPTQPFPVGRESVIERGCSAWHLPPGFTLRCEYFQPPVTDPPNVLRYSGYTRVSPMSFDPQTGYLYVQGMDRLDWQWQSANPLSWEFGAPEYLTVRVPNLDSQIALIFAAVDPKTYKVIWKKEMRRPPLDYGLGGWLTTGGGLALHRLEDGNLAAYDAKTGDELWKFQTGHIANAIATPMSYEVDGQQYISVIQDSEIWSFKLGGNVPPRPAPQLPEPEIVRGPIQDSAVIRASVPNDWDYRQNISPLKARVKAGTAVTFMNNTADVQTFVALDGSWSTKTLLPREQDIVTFDKPGNYIYHFKEHPWSYGLVIVTQAAPAVGTASSANDSVGAGSFAAQAVRGKDAYQQQCSLCHQSDLSGTDMVPALAGGAFTGLWRGKSAKELFDRTRTTMPSTAPGSLSAQTYLDLVAYLLQANGMPENNQLSEGSLASTGLP